MRNINNKQLKNKLIRLVTLCMATLAVLFFSTAAAFAGNGASSSITITADKTEAEPGDTISFTIVLGPVSDFGTMQMVLVIPEGLTYETGSGALAEGLKQTLGFDVADFTEVSRMVNGYASAADYSSDGDTVLCTFRCTVNEGFNGSAEVGLTKLEFYSCRNWQNHTGEYTVNNAVITVGSTGDPAGDPDPSGNTDPAVDPNGNTDPTGDPNQSGNTDPAGDPDPSGSTDPAADPNQSGSTDPAADPNQSGDTNQSGNTDPATDPSGNTDPTTEPDPAGETDPEGQTPSGETNPDGSTPDGQTPSGETTPDGQNPSGNTTPDGQTPSGDTTPDPGKNGENSGKNGQNGSESNDPSKNGSEGRTEPQKDTQTTFPWWAVVAAAVVVIAVLAIVFKRKKRKE